MAKHVDLKEQGTAQRLVAFLEAIGAGTKTSIRRRERNTYFRRVEVILISQVGLPHVTAYTRNLSSGGAGLLCRRTFKVGERFVTIFNLGNGLGKFILCKVTFCRYVSDSMYELGAQFEASAPYLNSNHRIPEDWIALARNTRKSSTGEKSSDAKAAAEAPTETSASLAP